MQYFECFHHYSASKGIAAPSTSVLPRLKRIHDVARGKHHRYGILAASYRFCRKKNVRLYAPMLVCEHFAGSAKACLHLVKNVKHGIVLTQFLGRGKVRISGEYDPAFALYGLQNEPGSMGGNGFLKRLNISKRNIDKPRCVRAEIFFIF